MIEGIAHRTLPALIGLTIASGATQAQAGSSLWRPEERVVLADYLHVAAVAADESVVYVVTPRGIAVYDFRFRRWEPPTAFFGRVVVARVWSAAVDPFDQSLWMATDGGLVNYQRRIDLFEVVDVVGGVGELWLDPSDPLAGIYFRAQGGWQLLPRGGQIPTPTAPPAGLRDRTGASLGQIFDRYPEIQTLGARVLTDDRMRTYRFTAGAHVPTTDEVFLGTDGIGLVRYDAGITHFERLPFGLLTATATAVSIAPGGVWAGGVDATGRSGITFISDDLQRFEYEEGPRVQGFGGAAVLDVMSLGNDLWIGTAGGVHSIRDGRDVGQITSADGLQSELVHAVAGSGEGVWIGTDRGLSYVRDGEVERVGEALAGPVYDLATSNDSVWVATAAGLGLSVVGAGRVVVAPGSDGVPELREPVYAVATATGVVVAATGDRLVVGRSSDRETGKGERGTGVPWLVERPIGGDLGMLTSLSADADGVWIGGERGFARYQYESRQFFFVNSPVDLPGRVHDVAAGERYVWVATDGGVVRFDKRAVEGR